MIIGQVLEAGAGKDSDAFQMMFDAIVHSSHAQYSKLEVMKKLIASREVGYFDNGIDIMLRAAIKKNNSRAVELVLKTEINLTPSSEKLIIDAVKAGDIEIEKSLLAKMAFKKFKQKFNHGVKRKFKISKTLAGKFLADLN